MASVAQRLAKLEERNDGNVEPARIIFLSGGEASDVEGDAVLAASGIRTTHRDVVFVTTCEQKPGSTEPSMPLRIAAATTIDGRPLTF